MRHLIIGLLAAVVAGQVSAAEDLVMTADEMKPVSIEIQKRVPVDIANVQHLRTYASTNNYYFNVHLRDGMRVLFSASYGIGGEAGQVAGILVERDGRFWFKSKRNPTGQLMLPPGMPFNSNAEHSLWDVGAYMELINRVAFSDPNAASHTATDVYAGKPEAAVVDFRGGTAGSTVTYSDALEVVFSQKIHNRSSSNWKVYYAKGVGPVAAEMREDMEPKGTFKFYVGE